MERKGTGRRTTGSRPGNPIKITQTQRERSLAARPKKQYAGGWLAGIMFFLLLLYIGGYVYSYINRTKINEVQIITGTADRPEIMDGIIVRDEKVFYSAANGVLTFSVPDRERIRTGTEVCRIRNEAEVAAIETKLQGINATILNMQSLKNDKSPFAEDIRKSNDSIKKTVDDTAIKFVSGDTAALYSMKEKLSQTLDIRNQKLLTGSGTSSAGIQEQKSIYEDQLNSAISTMTLSETGIVSYLVDGMESTLTIDNLTALPRELIAGKVDFSTISPVKLAETGKPVFKLIKSNTWYIASYIPSSLTIGWEQGDTVTLYIEESSGFSPVAMTVSKISVQSEFSYVVFSNTKYMTDYLDRRTISFRISDKTRTGLQIPQSAVVEKTVVEIPTEYIFTEMSKKMVKKSTATGFENTPVTVSYTSGENGSISNIILDFNKLKIGDVLVNPNEPGITVTLMDVTNVPGVYMTNTGTAVFKRISLENSVPLGEYIILDPAFNPNLKVHDRIASDIKNVQERQQVY